MIKNCEDYNSCNATPPEVLYKRLMDSGEPKSELAWYASRKIEELEKKLDIVEKLPHTADGVLITPELELWRFDSFRVYGPTTVASECAHSIDSGQMLIPEDWAVFYSTHEAAQAAKEEKENE